MEVGVALRYFCGSSVTLAPALAAGLAAACSPPFVSDTDESRAPGAPIGAPRPVEGAETGGLSGSRGTDGVPDALEGAVGVLEILDEQGRVSATCTATALAPDIVLTSSECATDCVRLRTVFPSRARRGESLTARCAGVEIKETTEGRGFALLRLATDGAGEALPEAKATLDADAEGKGAVEVRLVTARKSAKGVEAVATSACSLRYGSASAYTSHACSLGGAWRGGLLVATEGGAVLALFDRTVGGSRLATTSKTILER